MTIAIITGGNRPISNSGNLADNGILLAGGVNAEAKFLRIDTPQRIYDFALGLYCDMRLKLLLNGEASPPWSNFPAWRDTAPGVFASKAAIL